MNLEAKSVHYFRPSYDTKGRFNSYWHQIDEAVALTPRHVLEIGVGNGFVSKYLKERGINVKTLDIDYRLSPDIISSVLEMPFPNDVFDVISCCEVLEHLPYSEFKNALGELARVSQKFVILSLPDVTTSYRFNIELPRLRPIKKLVTHPFHRAIRHVYDSEHYWEIGKISYELKKIIKDLQSSGFEIIKTYQVFEFRHHRFFLLRKI
jgi:ubiquinone/menaquinone biosynthesis C-methylase UbiE